MNPKDKINLKKGISNEQRIEEIIERFDAPAPLSVVEEVIKDQQKRQEEERKEKQRKEILKNLETLNKGLAESILKLKNWRTMEKRALLKVKAYDKAIEIYRLTGNYEKAKKLIPDLI